VGRGGGGREGQHREEMERRAGWGTREEEKEMRGGRGRAQQECRSQRAWDGEEEGVGRGIESLRGSQRTRRRQTVSASTRPHHHRTRTHTNTPYYFLLPSARPHHHRTRTHTNTPYHFLLPSTRLHDQRTRTHTNRAHTTHQNAHEQGTHDARRQPPTHAQLLPRHEKKKRTREDTESSWPGTTKGVPTMIEALRLQGLGFRV